MASLSGSSAWKLQAAAIWTTFIFVVAHQVPSSMAARPVPGAANGVDEATPEWPCCRQYDGPPGAVPAEETDAVPATEPIVVIPAALVATPEHVGLAAASESQSQAGGDIDVDENSTDAAQPEWPCCRQYDGPPADVGGLNN